jgi:hypothetical protein
MKKVRSCGELKAVGKMYIEALDRAGLLLQERRELAGIIAWKSHSRTHSVLLTKRDER